MKLTRTERLLRIVQLAQCCRRITIDSLVDELGVAPRTVLRDLSTLRRVGLRCVYDAEAHSYTLDPASHLHPFALTKGEGVALLLVARRFVDARMVPMAPLAMSAALKLESALPSDIVKECERLLGGVHVGGWPTSDISGASDLLLRLLEAVADRRKTRVNYDSYSSGTEIQTVLRPYGVAFRGRGWYVIGYSEKHRETRMFKIERIVEFTVLTESFRPPKKKFSVDEFFGNAWHMIRGNQMYHVKVVFGRKVAGTVEEVSWHSTQRTRRRSDGTLVFEVDVAGINEIAWWILGYGDQAVVHEPEELRRLIATHAANVLRFYQNYGPDVPWGT